METESVDNEEGPWNEKAESVTNPEEKADETAIDTLVSSEGSLTMNFPRLPTRNTIRDERQPHDLLFLSKKHVL
jgi:hypothetical protein